jgi:hypothetical protein
MNRKQIAGVIAVTALFGLGCEQRHETVVQPAPSTPPTSVSRSETIVQPAPAAEQPAGAAATSSASSSSTKDASLPPADVALASPKSEQDGSGQSAVTDGERSQAMPMRGQANDYNTPDRAKQQNDVNTGKETNR